MNFLSLKSFSKPFPYIGSRTEHLLIGLFFGLFTFAFLAIFQPFNISKIESMKYLHTFGYGIVTCGTLFFSLGIFNKIFSQNLKDSWTIGKMLLLILTETFLIGGMILLYSYYYGVYVVGTENPLNYFFYTISIGCIPIAFFIIYLEKRLEKINQIKAKQVFAEIKSNKSSLNDEQISILTKNQTFNIALDNLLCIKAFGNYIEVYYLENEVLKKELLRKPLSQIAKQVKTHQSLNQCHRSFLVNFDKIEKVTGNARNFNLHLPYLNFAIPVSRNFPTTLIKNIKNAD